MQNELQTVVVVEKISKTLKPRCYKFTCTELEVQFTPIKNLFVNTCNFFL